LRLIFSPVCIAILTGVTHTGPSTVTKTE